MRLFIGFIIYNIVLILTLFYVIFFSSNDIKLNYLKDVSGISEEEGILLLGDYQIALEYIESNEEKSTILYSSPKAGELVYENQMITLFISKGYYLPRFKMLENQIYDDVKNYLESLTNNYQIEVLITFKKDNKLLDGLVFKQITDDEFIDKGEVLELIVISNPPSIRIPDFTGWYYKDVINYSYENEINIYFEYVEILYKKDYVIGQGVEEGSLVLKNSNPITIYLAKEN